MIVYFADRQLNILGQASTSLPDGLTIIDDIKTDDIETGAAIFECKIPFDDKTRDNVTAYTEAGNYILRSYNGSNEFYTIIETETDTKKREIYIYAEDAGLDLLNEICGAYEADKAYTISHYINKFAYDSGFQIGVNEISTLTRKLSWDSESTAAERIISVATQFDNAEISYSFEIDGLTIRKKFINIYKKRGNDTNIQLRLNQDIDSITTTKSIANVATALLPTGGTPEDAEKPINLSGYTYDDGDIYLDGRYLKSRSALKKWSRYLNPSEPLQNYTGHILKTYSYDTLSQSELCNRAVSELKKISEMGVNYEVELSKLPDNVKVGDRVNIIDDAGGLYLSTRILTLEIRVADQTQKAVLGDYLIKNSGISQKVADLAAQFAKNSQSAAKALMIANTAKTTADTAKTQAGTALSNAESAQTAADAAQTAANSATQSAAAAQTAADNAQAAVDVVEKDVAELETSVTNAQAAAELAQQAAANAETKATEAQTAASNAQTKADDAATAAATAQSKAETASTTAATAQNTAETAKTQAETAATTAAAAKADAAAAQADIDALGADLTTLSNTMSADYARKTELTETEASLQTQITQNAAGISSNASKIVTIDETANSAKETAESAQTAATAAQTKADTAISDAAAAQTAADNAASAAAAAQTEADNAKTAAATAQSVADKAKSDLETAKTDLATVQGRVDATEEDIATAQAAVIAAQAAADAAQSDATAAANTAAAAQTKANTAATDAANAQTAANDAKSKAELAQAAAEAAQVDATAAQTKADEAAAAATAAQNTANTAKDNAATAQTKADAAAAAAAAAQTAADDADAKAAQAAADLVTAQQNLASVTSRVDATEADIAAAEQAVATAQTAAEQAAADAATAQSTANTAKTNAATAQTAADNAKAAADQAQADATAAQKAADDAMAAVGDLAVRVTKTETDIVQTGEQIALLATKDEVATTISGYYTKQESDAMLSVKADEINSSVETQFSELQLGGRNLAQKSDALKWFDEWLSWVGTTLELQADGFVKCSIPDGGSSYGVVLPKISTIPAAGKYMLSFDAYSDNATQLDYIYIMRDAGNVSLDLLVEITNEPTRYEIPLNITSEYTDCGIMISSQNGTSFYIRNIQLERGTKATDWNPAPEDLDKQYSDLETNYKSEVKQLSDKVDISLSQNDKLLKHISFTDNGIIITSGENKLKLTLDNKKGIVFEDGDTVLGRWDGTNFYAGNIVVETTERAQFGNFAFVPRTDGSLSFYKVK